MTFSIQDFGKSNAAQFANSVSIAIPASPSGVKIAEFGLSVVSGGQVVLKATVGTQATLGSPDILYTILRDNTIINTVLASDLTANKFNEVGFNYTDTGPSNGYFAYSILAEITNNISTNTANVIGPVSFSGISLA
ncbi:hypothetical protein LOZ80_01430 [Paenibacillus sp. HWE-109]|uniref:hypothetical protein n=1 Tax=Paenibacillus sp. HWE-109 TaxID=1306526 RepID=UPI001EDD5E5C|nr:hypothetical protein [Paenibacillus sp. HWE-109]UKS27639.1 hypothetical protein LOZ80_01430 [Paenibacillus sp. HWE-109]